MTTRNAILLPVCRRWCIPMHMEASQILVLFKQHEPTARELGLEICSWLNRRGIVARLSEAGQSGKLQSFNADLVLVLGGDGTILGVARQLAGTGIPFFGINFGLVGFLAACGRSNWLEKLENLLTGSENFRECLILRWELHDKCGLCTKGHAVNEIVLGRGSLAHLTSINVIINGNNLGLIRSDGIMICSPVGSTAYCASAGGPVLFPTLQETVFLPVCPFQSRFSPTVMPGDCEYILRPQATGHSCWLTIDGQEGFALRSGQYLKISGWPRAIRFFSSSARFFQHLNICASPDNI